MIEVFVVTSGSLRSDDVQVHGVHWTHEHAERYAAGIQPTHGSCHIHRVRLDPIAWLVNHYFRFRGLTEPNATDVFLFLTSETGELADAYVHGANNWVRNNPEAKAGKRIDFEVGDVLMMLIKFCEKLNFDPLDAMVAKWESKGWTRDTSKRN